LSDFRGLRKAEFQKFLEVFSRPGTLKYRIEKENLSQFTLNMAAHESIPAD